MFPHRGDEREAQAVTGAARYDIAYDPDKRRWYLDASWKTDTGRCPSLEDLRGGPVLAVDVNKDHLAGWVIAADGNPLGQPIAVPVELAGLPADTRDGRLRAAISELIHTARTHSCRAFVIENLGFDEARSLGREHTGRRPNRGIRGRACRRMVSGIPTAKFRDRLTQMGRPALAGTPRHSVLVRSVRPPRGGLHDRQARARTASQAREKV